MSTEHNGPQLPGQLRLREGSLLAGYRLEAQVGAGGMATVWRARDERLGRLVALKIFLAPTADPREFFTTSRAAATLDDPHILPVYEVGEAMRNAGPSACGPPSD